MSRPVADDQIREQAAAIVRRAEAIAATTSDARIDDAWLSAQVALLCGLVDTLKRWTWSADDKPEAIVLTADQQTLLLEYSQIDRCQRFVADTGMPMVNRIAAHAELVHQGLIMDAPAGSASSSWLTDLGRTFASGLWAARGLRE